MNIGTVTFVNAWSWKSDHEYPDVGWIWPSNGSSWSRFACMSKREATEFAASIDNCVNQKTTSARAFGYNVALDDAHKWIRQTYGEADAMTFAERFKSLQTPKESE